MLERFVVRLHCTPGLKNKFHSRILHVLVGRWMQKIKWCTYVFTQWNSRLVSVCVEFRKFSLCLHGFPLVCLVSSHLFKMCHLGWLTTLNCSWYELVFECLYMLSCDGLATHSGCIPTIQCSSDRLHIHCVVNRNTGCCWIISRTRFVHTCGQGLIAQIDLC